MKNIFLLLLMLSALVLNSQTMPEDNDGNGFRNISTLDNLRWICENDSSWSWNYELDNDINCSETRNWNDGKGWLPIGNESIKFIGKFYGNGYTLDSIYINRPESEYQGFFGYVFGDTVELKKLTLTNIDIYGGHFTAGLVGKSENAKISFINVSGKVKSDSTYTGGVIGFAYSGLMFNVHSNVNVDGFDIVGGTYGCISNWCEVRVSSALGTVSGNDYVGGIAGRIGDLGEEEWDQYPARIFDSYSNCSVVGNNYVGGFAGSFVNMQGFIFRCFSTGEVDGYDFVGGFLGFEYANEWHQYTNIHFSYWDVDNSGIETSAGNGIVGKSTDEMKNSETYNVYNLDYLWEINSNNYPSYRDFSDYQELEDINISELSGSGTESDPYLINNANELNAVRKSVYSHFKLNSNIDLASTVIWNYGKGWTPISDSYNYNQMFQGIFDGNNYEIKGMSIVDYNDLKGLFGNISYAKVINVQINEFNVIGYNYVGSVVAIANMSTIDNVSSSGIISYGDYGVGGLVGHSKGSKFETCNSNVFIFANQTAGGLCGFITNNGKISTSYSKGNISGKVSIGGISGQVGDWSTSGDINDSYSHSTISLIPDNEYQSKYVGGLAGYFMRGEINRSYSTGLINGSGNLIGGFIGGTQQGAVASYCYWDTITSGYQTSQGGNGVLPRNTTQMKTKDNYHSSWNFKLLWDIDSAINNGYPYINNRAIPVTQGIEPLDTNGNGFRNIYRFEHLVWVSQNDSSWSWKFELDCDINCSLTYMWETLQGFSPIGNATKKFIGEFEGNGFTLDSLFISRNAHYQGLFGYIQNAKVRNLTIANINLNCAMYCGGLAGYVENSIVESVNINADITSSNNEVGGLIGYVTNSNGHYVRFCSSTGETIGITNVGGLIGNLSGTISDSYSHSNVNGTTNVGGLIGRSYLASIIHSYSTGVVVGTGSGLLGNQWTPQEAHHNCYWDTQTSERSTSRTGTGKTTEQMKSINTYETGWNFLSIWDINPNINNGYPYINLRANKQIIAIEPLDTNDNGYRNINKLEHLVWISQNPTSFESKFELDCDINCSETYYWQDNFGFVSIGNSTNKFKGEFEGNGFTLDSLYINRIDLQNQGLFGVTDNAKIRNLNLTNIIIIGHQNTGGLIGHSTNNQIINVAVNKGAILSSKNNIGGLAGQLVAGSIRYSHSNIAIKGSMYIGGISGYTTANIYDSYSNSNTYGYGVIGGFNGYNYGNVYRSYSAGVVAGTEYLGGFFGSGNNAVNCYWDRNTSGINTSAGGGVTGYTTAQMKSQSSYDASWNFEIIWDIDAEINNGYPFYNNRSIPEPIGIEPLDTNGNGFRNIYKLEHLVWISNHDSSWTWNFELDCDINARQTRLWSSLAGFKPIGTASKSFTGKFYGNGFIIDSLFISSPNSNTGFFGVITNNSEIKDLKLHNYFVTGGNYTGGLVGRANNSSIKNISLTGEIGYSGNTHIGGGFGYIVSTTIENVIVDTVKVQGSTNTGGLIGRADNSTIKNTKVNSRVISTADYIGGLIGYIYTCKLSNNEVNTYVSGGTRTGGLIGYSLSNSEINKCFTKGTVQSSKTYIGGLIGHQESTIVNDCYSFVNVSGTGYVGGLIGYSGSAVNRCYSTGLVSGTGSNFGGLIGFASTSSTYSYWNTQTSGRTTSAGGATGKTTVQMKDRSTYHLSWDYRLVWAMDSEINNGYPYINDRTIPVTIAIEPIDTDGNGFRNVNQFANIVWISQNNSAWNQSFELDNDINASSTFYWETLNGLLPIGTASNKFTGKFDGKGFTIDSIFISSFNQSNIGLFGYISSDTAIVKNLRLTNYYIYGNTYVGGLIGVSENGKIENCYTSGTLNAVGNYAGGLIGYANGGLIDQCSSNSIIKGVSYLGGLIGDIRNSAQVKRSSSIGDITGTSYLGGLIGYNSGGQVYLSSSNSTIIGTTYIGGLIGDVRNSALVYRSSSEGSVTGSTYVGGFIGNVSSNVNDCYSKTNVSGSSNVGGFTGYSNSVINRSYSTGSVIGTGSNIGGFSGQNMSQINNCYWDTVSSGRSTSSGGIGRNTQQMKNRNNYDISWNYYALWVLNENTNDGYPHINDRIIPNTVGIEPTDTDGDGFKNISTLAHLVWISQNNSSWNWNLELDNDIKASDTYLWEVPYGFSPIGSSTKKYTGKFNGNGFTIDSLFINRPTTDYVGMFGYISGDSTEIYDLTISNYEVYGKMYAGLVGRADNIKANNVNIINPKVHTTNQYVGSLAGYCSGSFVRLNNITTQNIDVNGAGNVGGIIGYISSSTVAINNVNVSGIVESSSNYCGGVIGYFSCGSSNNSKVENSSAKNITVKGTTYVGGFAGYSQNNNYDLIEVEAEVDATQNYAGGFLGSHSYGIIYRVNSNSNVEGNSYVGGFIGSSNSEIRNSKSLGNAKGTSFVGGFVGNQSGTIFDSFSHTNVEGDSIVGGLIGYQNSSIYRVFSTGSVLGAGAKVGGFVGQYNAGTIADCYWDTISSGVSISAKGIGLSTDDMQKESSFANYNFYYLWEINEGLDYPNFKDLSQYSLPTTVNLADLDGSGTELDPYIITNINELNAMRNNLTAHYKLANDIDASSTIIWNYGRGWTPIGTNNVQFTGSLNGQDYSIDGLNISNYSSYIGLFGYIAGAKVRFLNINNAVMYGGQYSGILSGTLTGLNKTTYIENVKISGMLNSNNSYSGGLSGHVSHTTVSNCILDININGTQNTGGFIGRLSNSNISKTYCIGKVLGTTQVGGFVGETFISGNIENCYTMAEVFGTTDVGGFVGYRNGGTFSKSYSIGKVDGSGSNIGGFAGRHSSGTTNYCYWDTITSGRRTTANGDNSIGRNTSQMTKQNNYTSWDFSNIWAINQDINDGYPFLRVFWELTPPMLTSPHNLSKDIEIDTILYWFYYSSTSQYHLQIAKDTNFTNIVLDQMQIETMNYTVSNLDYKTKYYWRMRATDVNDTTNWSNIWTFTTRPAIFPVVLSTPDSNAVYQPINVTLKWQKNNDADSYRVQTSLTSDFSSLINNEIVEDTLYTTNLNYNKIVYWRVQGIKGEHTSDWSKVWKFNTNIPKPTLTEPVHLSVCNELQQNFEWNNIDVADYYTLQISTDINFYPITILFEQDSINGNSFAPDIEFEQMQDYFWRVKTNIGDLSSDWSSISKFSTVNIDPISPIANMQPTNNSFGLTLPLTFSWEPSEFAKKYDIFIWNKDEENRPATPYVSNLSAINYTLPLNTLQYGQLYNWQVRARNDCDTIESEVLLFSLRHLPDVIVSNITIPQEVTAGQQMTVSWQIKNIGLGSTVNQGWKDAVYLSSDTIFNNSSTVKYSDKNNFTSLAPDAVYNQSATFTVPLTAVGYYNVFIFANFENKLLESNTANNIKRDTARVLVVPPPMADMTIESVANPSPVYSNNLINVSYVLKNIGDAPVYTYWYDKIYISSDSSGLNSNARLLNQFYTSKTYLNTNQTINKVQSVRIPVEYSGTYYIYVETNSTSSIAESSKLNNVKRNQSIQVILRPPPDFIVTNIDAPNSANSGTSFNVAMTVKNQGFNAPAENNWTDIVYLCSSAEFNSKNVVSSASKNVNWTNIPFPQENESYGSTMTINIPKGLSGNYYLFAETDVYKKVYEYSDANNVLRRSDPIEIILSPYADLVIDSTYIPKDAVAGDPIQIKWRVKNNGNLKATQPWNDEVYISSSPTFTYGATKISTYTNIVSIDSNASYLAQQTVMLPETLSTNNYYIYFVTDANKKVYEYNYENNNTTRASDSIYVLNIMTTQSDLFVEAMNFPDEVNSGQLVEISYEIKNDGPNSTRSADWFDKVFISKTPFIDTSAIQLLAKRRLGKLDSGKVYTVTDNIIIPNGISGTYYFIVRADVDSSNINEMDFDNNANSRECNVVLTPSIDFEISCNVPTNVSPGEYLTLPYTVKNLNETLPIKPWNDAIYVGTDSIITNTELAKKSHQMMNNLQKDSTYNGNLTLQVPKITGINYLVVKTDLNDANFEFNKNNNYISRQLNINYADLRVDTVIFPSEVFAGQRVQIIYKIKNYGSGKGFPFTNKNDATNFYGWMDRVYLGNSTEVISTSAKIGERRKTGTINPNSTYSDTFNIDIPSHYEGYYYLLTKTNAGGHIFEIDSNNNTNARLIKIIKPEPSNLIVTRVVGPDSVVLGNNATVNYRIKNIGANRAFGKITDATYLSIDKLLNPQNDNVVGSSDKYINLMPGDSTNLSITNKTQFFTPGNYYSIASTNIRSQILETNYEDNANTSDNTTKVKIEELLLDVTKSTTLNSGDLRYYQIELDDEYDLLLTLQSNRAPLTGANEVYVAYERVPTKADYDYRNYYPADVNQKVLIPSAQAGKYYALFRTTISNADYWFPQNVQILARAIPFSVSDITPKKVGDARVTTRVFGGGFKDSTLFYLYKPNTDSIVTKGKLVDRISSMEVKVRWELWGIEYGMYDVIAINDIDTVISTVQLEIEEATDFELGVYVNEPIAINFVSSGNYYYRFTNTSNIDIPYCNTDIIIPKNAATIYKIQKTPNVILMEDFAQKTNNYFNLDSAIFPENNIRSFDVYNVLPIRVINLTPNEDYAISFNLKPKIQSNINILHKSDGFSGFSYLQKKINSIENIRLLIKENTQNIDDSELLSLIENKYNFRDSLLKAAVLMGEIQSIDTVGAHELHLLIDSIVTEGDIDIYQTLKIPESNIQKDIDGLLQSNNSCRKDQVNPCAVWDRVDLITTCIDATLSGIGAAVLFKKLVVEVGKTALSQGVSIILTYSQIANAAYSTVTCAEKLLEREANPAGQEFRWYADNIQLAHNILSSEVGTRLGKSQLTTLTIEQFIKIGKKLCETGWAQWLRKNAKEMAEAAEKVARCQSVTASCEIRDNIKFVETHLNSRWNQPNKCKGSPESETNVYVSKDPNDITGPEGYGDDKWISVNDRMNFRIRFENDAELATAPAQRVYITQTLDSTVNPLTFRLGNFGFANEMYEVPANRAAYYTVLNLPDSLGYDVEVTAGINTVENQIFWVFQSIDPATGLPPSNPTVGLLPINDSTGIGEGFVNYTIFPAQNCVTGDYIVSQADIIFDINEVIETNIYTNRVDAFAPTSKLQVLRSDESDSTYVVYFEGKDDEGGTGIAGFELWVAELNSDEYLRYKTTFEDNLTFTGELNKTYKFVARGRDFVWNLEELKITPDTIIYIDKLTPKLIRPINLTNLPTDNTFIWNKYPNAINYQMQISTDNFFTSNTITIDSLADTTAVYSTLDYNVAYYWRVKALINDGYSKWSDTWSFTKLVPLNTPILSMPENNETGVSVNPTLTWFKVSNALNYDLHLSKTNTFDTVITYSNITDTLQQLSNINQQTAYYWRVKANDDRQSSEWSEIWKFTTESNEIQIPIKQGWNLISTYVAPNAPDSIQFVTAGLNPNLVIMKNAAGRIYMPNGINQLGRWDVKLGYQVYLSKADTLAITGTAVVPENTPIYLNNGWSIIPYLRNSPLSIVTALASITDAGRLIIVKRSDGKIYMPGGINQIGNQIPGEAYQAYLNARDTLIYPANALGRSASSNSTIHDFDSRFLKPDYENTGNTSNLILEIDFPNGTELAVVNADDKIIGTSRVVNNLSSIVLWGDNQQTQEIDGAGENHQLRLKIYDNQTNTFTESKDIEITDLISGKTIENLYYKQDMIFKVNSKQSINSKYNIIVTPNPLSSTSEIVYTLDKECDIELSLYNLSGRKVLELLKGVQSKGTHKVILDAENLSSGNYNLILKNCGTTINERVVIVK